MKQILAFLLAGVLGLTLLISLNASQRRSAAAELSLSETAKAAVAQTAAELETLTLSLEKLLVTTSPRQQAKQLSALTVSADRAQISLCALPDSEGQRGAVLAYLSRLSHLAQTALADLAEGDGFHTEVRSDLSSMLDGMRLLQAELAIANSADASCAERGGVLNVSDYDGYGKAFVDWALADGRKAGEVGFVKNDFSVTKGYHIMYYVGENAPYWEQVAESTLLNEQYGKWQSDILAGYPAEKGDGLKYVG